MQKLANTAASLKSLFDTFFFSLLDFLCDDTEASVSRASVAPATSEVSTELVGAAMTAQRSSISRADRKSQVRQCLGFYSADL